MLSRAEDHQCLTPRLTPNYEDIIYNFLTKRDALDLNHSSEAGIDRVIRMDLFGHAHANITRICADLGWKIPSLNFMLQDIIKF